MKAMKRVERLQELLKATESPVELIPKEKRKTAHDINFRLNHDFYSTNNIILIQ